MWLLEARRAEEVAPSIEETIRRADLIILSIPYGEIAPLIKKYAEALRDKIVIDSSNPIAPLPEGAFAEPCKVLFYASDCPIVQEDMDALITDAGFIPLYLGGLEHSICLEVFGSLHGFGALGKTVTLEEAMAVL